MRHIMHALFVARQKIPQLSELATDLRYNCEDIYCEHGAVGVFINFNGT